MPFTIEGFGGRRRSPEGGEWKWEKQMKKKRNCQRGRRKTGDLCWFRTEKKR